MRYAIVIEQAGGNVGAYAPDVPGVGVTAATPEDAVASLREALSQPARNCIAPRRGTAV